MKKTIMPYVAKALSSDLLKAIKSRLFALKRQLLKQEPILDIFLKVDDPYSYLLIQVLVSFRSRFSVQLRFHVVQTIDPEMFPKLEMWVKNASIDAHHLAQLYDLEFPGKVTPLDTKQVELLTYQLVAIEGRNDFLETANKKLHSLWFGRGISDYSPASDCDVLRSQLNMNERLLKKQGHYLSAMIYFEGEWYWGIDRLDHLERRLIELGFAHQVNESVQFDRTYRNFCDKPLLQIAAKSNTKDLILYWSARSPYSYIGLERAVQLADHYKITIKIKPVLPMMMRGMNVPSTKKMYIFLDTKREAQKLGLPYGFVADPLGAAVERCYALVDYARSENKLQQFLLSFARGVNAQGIRAETDQGMRKIVEHCGLDWALAKHKLQDQSWKKWTKENLDEMFLIGCWGVPSFQYGDVHFWGQDRLGMIEQTIRDDLSNSF